MKIKKIDRAMFKKKSLLFIAVFTLSLSLILGGSSVIAAAEEGTKDAKNPVRDTCIKYITNGAKAACDDNEDHQNIKHARYTASYHCKDKSADDGTKLEDCINDTASKFIKEAATKDPKPKSENGFTARLTSDLEEDAKATGGAIDQPFSQAAKSPADYCEAGSLDCTLDPAACEAAASNGKQLQGCPNPGTPCSDRGCDLVGKYVNPGIAVLTAIFGLISVISIIAGAIQYSASAGDPQKVTAAKRRIIMTITAIVAYAFLYSFIQFLIPGGVFG